MVPAPGPGCACPYSNGEAKKRYTQLQRRTGKLVGEKVYNFRSNREGREATRSVLLDSEPGEDRPKAAANPLPGSERPECGRKDRGGVLASLPAEQHDPGRWGARECCYLRVARARS